MTDLLKEAFSNCIVSNSCITFSRSYTPEELRKIYQEFTVDLYNCKIPHNRVVGFAKPGVTSIGYSMFKTNPIFNMSAIELGFALNCIVPKDIGGNDPERGCYYSYSEDVSVDSSAFDSFNRAFGNPKAPDADSKRANPLTVSYRLVGQLACGLEYPPKIAGDDTLVVNEDFKVTTDNLWYMQFGLVQQAMYPKMLVKNKVICDLLPGQPKGAYIHVFYMRGTGRKTYEENQELFIPDWVNIVPVPTEYDLTRFFVCKRPLPTDTNVLRLTYLENIDEDVLCNILNKYGLGE